MIPLSILDSFCWTVLLKTLKVVLGYSWAVCTLYNQCISITNVPFAADFNVYMFFRGI
jgi:hypothetical protein